MIHVSNRAHADDFSLADTDEFEDGLSDNLRARVKRELDPGERLLWAAQGDPPLQPRGPGFYFVCMITLVLVGMAIFFIMLPGAGQLAGGDFAIGLGLVLLVPAGLLFMGLIAGWNGRRTRRRQLKNACYAITDRRVVIWIPEPKGDAIRVQALRRGQFGNVVRIERPDGSGTLQFSGAPGDLDFGYYQRCMLANIPDVRRVEQIVRNNLMTSEPVA